MTGPRIHYRVDGTRGPWVTFITGIANDTTMWSSQMPALTGDYRVLRYDLRGQGGSEATPPPYSIDLLVGDLLRLWRQLGVPRTHLIGLGLGGAIAQAAAADHADKVTSVMPCCCRARMVPDFAAMWERLIDEVKKKGVEAIVEPTAQRWFSDEFKAANPAVLDEVRKMIRRTSQEGYLGCAGAFLKLSIEEKLADIKVPTLYLSGADDKLGGPPALMAGLAAKVAGARHESVPNAAHIANIQNPAGFNRLMVAFLKEHS